MLRSAGLEFKAMPAAIDETAIIQTMTKQGRSAGEISATLAQEKALAVAKKNPDTLVIGSDQILQFKDQMLEKAASKEEALEKLRQLSGHQHSLISSVAIARNNEILWQYTDSAHLTMRLLDDDFLNTYAEKAGDALTACVGAYELEGLGAQLFSHISGDYFTILGLPLLPLLEYLRDQHGVGL